MESYHNQKHVFLVNRHGLALNAAVCTNVSESERLAVWGFLAALQH